MASLKQLEKRLKKIQEQRIPEIDVIITDDREFAETYQSKAKECIIIIDDIEKTYDPNEDIMEHYRIHHPRHYEMLMRLRKEDEEAQKTAGMDKWVKGDTLYVRKKKGAVGEVDLTTISKDMRERVMKDAVTLH